MNSDSLMQAFDFDERDLQANRAGELTHEQRERVAAAYQQFLRRIPPTLGIIGAIMVSAAVISQVRGFVLHELVIELPIWLYLFGIMVLIVGVGSYWLTMGVRRGRIQVAQGMATLETGKHGPNKPYFHAKIGTHTFYLADEVQLGAFIEAEPYHVYYVPYWPDVILSAEKINSEQPN
jgi:hypothetical protein